MYLYFYTQPPTAPDLIVPVSAPRLNRPSPQAKFQKARMRSGEQGALTDTNGSMPADEFGSENKPFRSGEPGGNEADAQERNTPREGNGSSCRVLQRCAAVQKNVTVFHFCPVTCKQRFWARNLTGDQRGR